MNLEKMKTTITNRTVERSLEVLQANLHVVVAGKMWSYIKRVKKS